MEAVIQSFIKNILDFTRDQLFDLCVQLKRDNCGMDACIREYRASDKVMARDYQHALQKIKDQDREIHDLKKTVEHLSAQKQLLTRDRFGSHNEKMNALHASSGEDIQDPLSEDQVLAEAAAGEENAGPVAHKKQVETGAEKEDRAARTAARKAAREALGDARNKKNATKMDLSKMPHKDTYDIDTDELDRKYGEGNWRIAFWRKEEIRNP
jgi:hypothetical protein